MARASKKKVRAHVAAANSQAARWKANGPKGNAPSATSALGAAAVAATFGADDDEAQPLDNEQSGDEDGGDNSALSRGQRKRMKRRTAFMKKMGLVQRVTQEKAKEQKQQEQGMFADLAELQASLFQSDKDAKKSSASVPLQKKKMSGKQRQKLAVRELVHLKAVHSHSSFQGNPFAAIQMHLQNTVVQANQENVKKTSAAAAKKAASSMDTK
ncbi:Cystathionine gamma-synthase [Globisporangium polare]